MKPKSSNGFKTIETWQEFLPSYTCEKWLSNFVICTGRSFKRTQKVYKAGKAVLNLLWET